MFAAPSLESPTPSEDPRSPADRARVLRRALVVVIVAVAAIALWVVSRVDTAVHFERGVDLLGVTAPDRIAPGQSIDVTLHLRVAGPLPSNYWFFGHLESSNEHGDRNCRTVVDGRPTKPSTQWSSGAVDQSMRLTLPAQCKSGRMTLFAGLWDPANGARLKVLAPSSLDQRIDALDLDVVEPSSQPSAPVERSGRSIALASYSEPFRPLIPWVFAIAFTSALSAALWLRGHRATTSPPPRHAEAIDTFVYAASALLFLLGILTVLEFIKDDAYISFRYAHNLVKGRGFVFNPGERLEGFTNFSWTLLLSPFEALGWDLFQVCEVLGSALGLALLWQLGVLSRLLQGTRSDFGHWWASLWIAGSSSFVLWAKSGLEQPLATLLPVTGAWILWKAPDPTAVGAPEKIRRAYFASGVVLGLGCATRPELHLITALIGLPLLWDLVRRRQTIAQVVPWVVGVLLVTVPFHAFRLAYYHSLVPNTYYVKTSSSAVVWRAGLGSLHDLFEFNSLGWVAAFAPLAFLDPRRRREKLVMATISVAFFLYIVRVGVDEMQWHRLYLPALPFLILLSAMGLGALVDAIAQQPKPAAGRGASVAAWALVLSATLMDFRYTYGEFGGFNGHADLAGTYHPDLGKFITRHERAGGLVAFQDMGSTPYHAPDVDFLDFIGLVDGHVARARNAHGLHAFVDSGQGSEQEAYDAEMREYFYRRNPEWTILTVYPPSDQEARIASDFAKDPGPKAIGDAAYANNTFQFGLWKDPKFHQRYEHVRTWQRSRGYYLSLYRRRDLFDQIPREVVLDAPPADLTGPKASLGDGVELLGATVDPQTVQRGEVYVTTWWKVPGPQPEDTWFFLHVISADGKYQAAYDHVPGDWMYAANRWRAGDLVEDRVLFQLPVDMPPGDYTVKMGIYRRATGERAPILSGPDDGTGRLTIGTFHVKRLLPLLDQLIPPTRPEHHRKYPDRIVPGR
ncbi:MAG: hypothetical protein ACHREM_19995 [Polyangiales bacterium]